MAPRSGKTQGAGASPRLRSKSPAPDMTATYTWEQVAEHNTAESAWVIVEGIVYDITPWIESGTHPGGKEVLLLSAGRECTELFASYHPFTDKPGKVIQKFKIGKVVDTEFPMYAPDTGFYKTLRQRVGDYFRDNNIDPKDPIPGIWRMAVVFSTAAFCYCAMNNLVDMDYKWRMACAALFGICQALPLLHVMHDSSHTAFGHNETWWKVAGRLCMDWYAGASMMSWHHQHVVGHHIYTNVLGADPDMPVAETGDPRRIVKRQIWASIYKWQHIYLPPLYGVLGLKFRIQDFTDTFFSGYNGPVRVNLYDSVFYRLFVVKLVWSIWRVVIPLVYLQVPVMQYIQLFFIAEVMTGYWLAFNFQVSHVSLEADFPHGDETVVKNASIEDEWAVSQVKSSVDYSHGTWITAFVSGALNYQTVHHLFPCVSQYKYPEIAPIVKEVCKEYGVQYNHLPSFWTAFTHHIHHLHELGNMGKAAHID